jgi:hypothetical protein
VIQGSRVTDTLDNLLAVIPRTYLELGFKGVGGWGTARKVHYCALVLFMLGRRAACIWGGRIFI